MRTSKFLFAVACVLGLTASCLAQNTETKKTQGILGYLDPTTGAFRPLRHGASQADPATITPTTGKLVFNITIAVNSGLSTSAKILCSASAIVVDTTSGSTFEDNAVASATRSSNTATCSLTIPYGWDLAKASSDVVELSVVVSYTVGTLGTAPYSDGQSAQALSIPVPASGATTTETIATSI